MFGPNGDVIIPNLKNMNAFCPIVTSLEVALNEKLVNPVGTPAQVMLSAIAVIVYVSLTFSGKTKLAPPR